MQEFNKIVKLNHPEGRPPTRCPRRIAVGRANVRFPRYNLDGPSTTQAALDSLQKAIGKLTFGSISTREYDCGGLLAVDDAIDDMQLQNFVHSLFAFLRCTEGTARVRVTEPGSRLLVTWLANSSKNVRSVAQRLSLLNRLVLVRSDKYFLCYCSTSFEYER